MKKVSLVPEQDIKRLEEARVKLCNLTDKYPVITQRVLFEITPAMWQITHRKYDTMKIRKVMGVMLNKIALYIMILLCLIAFVLLLYTFCIERQQKKVSVGYKPHTEVSSGIKLTDGYLIYSCCRLGEGGGYATTK